VLEICIFIGTICCLTSVILLRRSDRQMAELRNDNFDSSSQRLKSIESAAGDIRKELLDVQQERDILLEKLKVKEEEYHKLHLAFDDTIKKNSDLQRSVSENSLKSAANRKTKQESEVSIEPKSPMSRDQREQLMALLDPGPKGDIDILSVIGDDTSSLLAKDLNEIFKADGWTTKGVAQSAFSKVPEGIVLSVHSKETAPSYASFIQRTMATIGFPVSAAVNNKYREWSLTLIVGKV
jgi:hypothetical protein